MVLSRRRAWVVAGALMTAMGIASACGFPTPALTDDPGSGGDGGAGGDGSSGGPNGQGDSTPAVDAPVPEDPPPIDATSEKPAVAPGCDPCDCDDDGFNTRDGAVCDAAAAADSGDCDDLDERANPNATFRDDLVTDDTKGDWNCNGITERKLLPVKLRCESYDKVTNNCAALSGFDTDPPCGAAGNWITCKDPPNVAVLTCVPNPDRAETRVQECR